MTHAADADEIRARGRTLFRLTSRALLHQHDVLAMARHLDPPTYEFALRGPDRPPLRRRWRWELFESRVPFAASRSRIAWLALDHLLLAGEKRARAALGGGGRSGAGRRYAWVFGHEHLFVTQDGVAFWLRAYDDRGRGGDDPLEPRPDDDPLRVPALQLT